MLCRQCTRRTLARLYILASSYKILEHAGIAWAHTALSTAAAGALAAALHWKMQTVYAGGKKLGGIVSTSSPSPETLLVPRRGVRAFKSVSLGTDLSVLSTCI